MKMKKLLLILTLMLSTPVFAQNTVDVSGLSAAQIAELKKSVIDAKLQKDEPTNISAIVRQEAGAWGDMGANMGKAMVGAAKEMGVAANDFSQTSLGKVTVGIVVYKIIGRDILKIVVGLAVLILGSSISLYLLFSYRWGKCIYETKPALFGLLNKRYVISYEEDSDQIAGKLISSGIVLVLTMLVGLNCIF
jgi:hypothetical protein